MSTLPALLQHYMDQRGWSQYKLAMISGLSEPTISRLMSGKIKGQKAETILTLAETLNAPPEELLDAAGHTKLAEQYRQRIEDIQREVSRMDAEPPWPDDIGTKIPEREKRRKRPGPGPKTLAKLARDPDPSTRRWVAEHDTTPPEILAELAEDKDWEVRDAVCYGRARVPRDILNKLLQDRRREVMESARSALNWKEYAELKRARIPLLDQVVDLVHKVAALSLLKEELRELHPNDIEESLETMQIMYDKLLCNHEAIQRFGFKRRQKGRAGKGGLPEEVQEASGRYDHDRVAGEALIQEFEQLCNKLDYTEVSRTQFKNMSRDAQRQFLDILHRKEQAKQEIAKLLNQKTGAS